MHAKQIECMPLTITWAIRNVAFLFLCKYQKERLFIHKGFDFGDSEQRTESIIGETRVYKNWSTWRNYHDILNIIPIS